MNSLVMATRGQPVTAQLKRKGRGQTSSIREHSDSLCVLWSFLSFFQALLVSSELESFSENPRVRRRKPRYSTCLAFLCNTTNVWRIQSTCYRVIWVAQHSLDTVIIASRTAIFISSQNMLTLSTEQLE